MRLGAKVLRIWADDQHRDKAPQAYRDARKGRDHHWIRETTSRTVPICSPDYLFFIIDKAFTAPPLGIRPGDTSVITLLGRSILAGLAQLNQLAVRPASSFDVP